jgi:hypothetical protein
LTIELPLNGMSKCTPQFFEGITVPMWNRIVEEAMEYGLPITGNSGRKTKDGFDVSWNFEPATGHLELQCHDSPFWAPCAMIQKKIVDLVADCRA